jgi:4-hydroxy-2-oxoheptanedioate aldolase
MIRRNARTAAWLVVGFGLLSAAAPAVAQSGGAKGRLNPIIEQFEQGKPAFNTEHWQLTSLEHNPFMMGALEKSLQSARPEGSAKPRYAPIARIPHEGDQDFKHIVKQILDAGAFGIVLPQVRTKEEAARLVRAMRYPPQRGAKYPNPPGIRGWGPTGALRLWGLSADDYARKADLWPLNPEGELLAIVMIETREGVKNINEILSVPGLAGVLIGPSDLSLSLGVGTPGPNVNAPEVEEATATVAKACVALKRICGTFESPNIDARVAQGFRLFTRASK